MREGAGGCTATLRFNHRKSSLRRERKYLERGPRAEGYGLSESGAGGRRLTEAPEADGGHGGHGRDSARVLPVLVQVDERRRREVVRLQHRHPHISHLFNTSCATATLFAPN